MDNSTVAQIVTAAVSLLIAMGGWIFAWRQERRHREKAERDVAREQRQQKADRVLGHLEQLATLVSLYRILANATNKLLTDADGRPILDATGAKQVVNKEIYPDEWLEGGLMKEEGEDTKGMIALQAYRVHEQHGRVGDLLVDLDPTGATRSELSLLYLHSTRVLEHASNSGDFWQFVEALQRADEERAALRARVQGLVDLSKTSSSLKRPTDLGPNS